jgi:nucleoside-diphosphate-sugar epimerase
MNIRKSYQARKIFQEVKLNGIIHLATLASVNLWERYGKRVYETNFYRTLNVPKACEDYNAKLIFASSTTACGDSRVLPTPETAPLFFINRYGITKIATELIVKGYQNHVIFRLINAYGLDCQRSHVTPDVMRKLSKRKSKIPMKRAGNRSRNFIYINDVLDLFEKALKSDYQGVYNVSSIKTVTIKELVLLIFKLRKGEGATYF